MPRALLVFLCVLLVSLVAFFSMRKPGSQQPMGTAGQPLRIVSLSPAMTEFLFAINLGDSIVGVAESCDYPEAAKNLPRVGGLGSTNLEALLALRPTLVVTTDFETDDTLRALKASGARVIEGHIATIPQMFASFATIAAATNRLPENAKLQRKMQGELDAISRNLADIPREQRPHIYIEVWHDPATTAGKLSFLDDVVDRAGAFNVAAEINQGYPIISPEKVIQWNPDVILLCNSAARGKGQKMMEARLGWDKIHAVTDHRVIDDIDLDLLIRPGPRLTEGIAGLYRRLYHLEKLP